jgi:hypothetical protein
LNKIYIEAEMEQATNTPKAESTKPVVSMPTPRPIAAPSAPQASAATNSPDDETRKANKWISTAQEKRIYGMCKSAGVPIDWVKACLSQTKGYQHLHQISWAGDEYKKLCDTIEKNPEFFKKYEVSVETPPATVQGQDEFVSAVYALQGELEWDDAAINQACLSQTGASKLADVPADKQQRFIDYLRDSLEFLGGN